MIEELKKIWAEVSWSSQGAGLNRLRETRKILLKKDGWWPGLNYHQFL